MDFDDKRRQFFSSLVAGAIAGMSVDLALFPLDTVKTRLQSQFGFQNSGGFKQLYRGLGSAMIVSAPNAAAFFSVYEYSKVAMNHHLTDPTLINMTSASLAETAACLIRVPVEVVKQRTQASKVSWNIILKQALREDKLIGMYRGFLSTLSRDIPFALIQLPLWEHLKKIWAKFNDKPISAVESCICGSLAGLCAAIATNPIDVAKTRIMLAKKDNKYGRVNFLAVISLIFKESGFRGLYSGASPRILFITIGGAVYLGGYDFYKSTVDQFFLKF
ncbi:S-adenosylmethionine mitochondrial carrier protein [Tetranychus urticae]|uniref:Mitochondrial carrier protein n=1 Tax=Tetranychus urticae TaxID=32264 RepID=T1KLM7_TETUR|nr:S-adenosylmethionine mitochondrial carrier protein [Tetranychus urticae]